MIRKPQLDLEVAFLTQVGQKRVRAITQTFLRKVMRALIEGHVVHLAGFGQLRMVEQGGAPPPHARFGAGKNNSKETGVRFRVHFKRSTTFTREVKRYHKENSHGEVRSKRVR